MNDVEERAETIDFVQFSCQRRRQIESESIDVHFRHPVPQAVHQQLERAWMPHVQRVAASRVIHVVARLPFDDAIICGVVDTPEANRRAQLIALRGVVVNDVQNDLETGAVQSPNHVLEFSYLIAGRTRRRETRVRGKESQRVVSPVVGKAALHEMPIRDRVMYRHQLD